MRIIFCLFAIHSFVALATAITPLELQKRLNSGEQITLIDLRPTPLYQQSHIEGAINVPHQICGEKKLPPLGQVVVYDDGVDVTATRASAEKLRRNPGVKVEILDGGLPAWESFNGKIAKPAGAVSEKIPMVTYDKLKKIQNDDVVLIDLRKGKKSIAGAVGQPVNNSNTESEFTDLKSEFPKAKVASSPFAVAGVSGKSLVAGNQTHPLLVLIDNNDGSAQEAARQLRANGIHRFVILVGGEEILKRHGKPGLQRSGSSFTVPVASPSQQQNETQK